MNWASAFSCSAVPPDLTPTGTRRGRRRSGRPCRPGPCSLTGHILTGQACILSGPACITAYSLFFRVRPASLHTGPFQFSVMQARPAVSASGERLAVMPRPRFAPIGSAIGLARDKLRTYAKPFQEHVARRVTHAYEQRRSGSCCGRRWLGTGGGRRTGQGPPARPRRQTGNQSSGVALASACARQGVRCNAQALVATRLRAAAPRMPSPPSRRA